MGINEDAQAFAQAQHAGQQRKGSDTPYIVHPEAVAAIVAEHTADPDLIAAAWLHDVVEDTGVEPEEIAARFGDHVAALVSAVTERDRSLPWEARKRDVLAHLAEADDDAVMLKAADALANARNLQTDLARDGQSAFDRFNRGRAQQLWWYCSLAALLAPRVKASGLGRQLRATVDAVCFAALRRPRDDELDALLDLTEKLFEPPASWPAGWRRDEAHERAAWWLADEARMLIVSEGPDGLLGYVAATVDLESIRFGRRCWVEDLIVEPVARKQGHGAALMAAARHWARERGCSHLELDTGLAREEAQRFYARDGGTQSSFVYAWVLP